MNKFIKLSLCKGFGEPMYVYTRVCTHVMYVVEHVVLVVCV